LQEADLPRVQSKKDTDVTSSSARDVFATLRNALSSPPAVSIADISRRLNITNNKAYRAVTTLERLDYLQRNPVGGNFTIGPAAERLVQQAFRRLEIRTFLLPYLRQIATSAEETAGLVIRIGWYGIRVANIESRSNVVARANRLGAATVLGDDAAGLAILSTFTAADMKRFTAFANSKSADGEGAVSKKSVSLSIEALREKGFVIVTNEQLDAIAIPLGQVAEKASAAVTIEAPPSRTVPLHRDPRVQSWVAIAQEAEAALRVNPKRFVDPFAHLDPDTVTF
jgi:DNA-binding IclR family transcriptional regulator